MTSKKEYQKNYRQKNLEAIRAKDRKRYQQEKPKRLAMVKRWTEANPDKVKSYQRKSKYNLTVEQFETLRSKQNDACAICNTTFVSTPYVDHDHACCSDKSKSCGKCVRGLLCRQCNSNLGIYESGWFHKFQDSIEDYLNGQIKS